MTTTPRSPSTGSLSSIAAAPRRSTLKVPTRLMSMTLRNVSRSSGPFLPTTRPGVPTPAQLTTTRRSPSSLATSIAACNWAWSRTSDGARRAWSPSSLATSIAACTWASSRTSAGAKRAWSPSSSARAFPLEEGRSTMTTEAPPSCRRRTVASPRPDAPPVTSATVESLMFTKVPRCGVGTGWSAAQQLTGDDQALDLVGALEDLGHLGLAHVALDREVLRVTVATEDLDRIGGDPHRGVGAHQLGDRG